MAHMKTIFELTDDRGELVLRLAEMAGILRAAHAAGAAEPVLCLYDCDPRQHASFGRTDFCTGCASRVLPASTWHRLLVLALRACPQTWADWRAAA